MTDRPIIFSGPMVRALLEGRKTMTRRIIKPRKQASIFDGSWSDEYVLDEGNASWRAEEVRYAVGDRLYVRENGWERPERSEKMMRDGADTWAKFYFDADGENFEWLREHKFKRRPSIHMPRWASRLTLQVTGVKVERLQDITEDDAKAEGCEPWLYPNEMVGGSPTMFRKGFQTLWQSLNAKRAPWDSNPWVVAVSLSVEKINIDALKEAA